MSIPDSVSVPMTPYRPTGPLITLQTSFGTPGPCTTPYYHFGTPNLSAESGTKSSRKRPNGKENSLKKKKKKSTIADLSTYNKLQYFYGFLREELKWTYGELLFHTSHDFSGKEDTSLEVIDLPGKPRASREQMAATMQHFFNGTGHGGFLAGLIVENWLKHPYGRLHRDSELMYSTTVPYSTIKPIRPALSSFAAQLVESKLVKEAEAAIMTSSGLHVSISAKKSAVRNIEWTDIGTITMEKTQEIFKAHQPLTWSLILKLASRPPRKDSQGVLAIRQKRPPEFVATGVISTLNFSRSSRAKLLPLATGLLYFGSLASTDLYRFRSRMGEMPSYSSIVRAMQALSQHEASVTLAHGRDANTLGAIVYDNVQNYHIQRDQAIGRENRLNIGLAATYYEVDIDDIDISVFDLDRKLRMIDRGGRAKLSVAKLQDMIDQPHIENVCILQWIHTLAQHIPQLRHLKPDIGILYRTRVAKQRLPVKAAKVHPLASSSRNETHFTDLKDALIDFFAQIGQTPQDFKRRLFPVGGDGLTYEKMLQLKEYLQFHENEQESFEILQPMLEWWHTEWTNLSRIFESHWGTPFSHDPSTLGNSAEKIGRKKPADLKKVDYYASVELAYLVLDVRILDCWRIYYETDDLFDKFDTLHDLQQLPTLEDLEVAARQLYRTYTSVRAQEKAMEGDEMVSSFVPRGTQQNNPVPPTNAFPTSTQKSKSGTQPTGKKATAFLGDQVLARSIAFMRETMLARETTLAIAEGDVGRVWEVIKIMVFSFAGSTHSKYTNYLLETITDLELECDGELQKALLATTLVNLSGKEGRWSARDFIQEYFNRLLEAVVQRKGVEYGDKFIRNVWSRNIHHIARLKLAWLDSVGLQRHSAQHTGAKQEAEVRILLDHYKDTSLHSLHVGRIYDTEPFVDDYQRGIQQLRGGKLKKWVYKTTRSRGLRKMEVEMEISTSFKLPEGSDDDDEEDSEDIQRLSAGVNREELRFSFVTEDNTLIFNQMELHEGIDEIFGKKEGEMESESDTSDHFENN